MKKEEIWKYADSYLKEDMRQEGAKMKERKGQIRAPSSLALCVAATQKESK